ncbi:MAG: hypothetical protein JOY96_02360 [Verrucomicrobia bacterium]|nr:hypothetical protein [Verrucomicrobiota bacterium]
MRGLKSTAIVCGFAIAATLNAAAQPVTAPPPNLAAAQIHAEIRADVAQIKANAKTSATTRAQIQQLRTALKAKLAALRK